MVKRQIPQKARRRLIVLGPIAVFLIGYCLFTLVTTVNDLYNLHSEKQELETELETLKSDAQSLKTEINKLQDEDYIARYARENYLYTRNGEYVIQVNDDEEEATEETKENNQNYIIYGCLAVFLLIIIFIIYKSHKRKKIKNKKRNN